ncbi:helix-hairpin-helix domain-containing protein [Pseudarthrobacter sp. NPDC055928]|uniref:helix-hairpin-helix domain-containing protein n=1 Tax=Pseudarthrobacter sp. NPDC055928 TaxID=3345661 RepID=UPI0035DE9D1F
MSRREAGAASPGARHAGSRLQATLGSSSAGLLPGGEEAFVYGSSGQGESSQSAEGFGGGASSDHAPAIRASTPSVPVRRGPVLRWRLGLKSALLVGAVAVLCGAWFWWQVSAGRPEVLPISEAASSGSSVSASPDMEGGQTAGTVAEPSQPVSAGPAVLHVAGAVARPGVVELSPGSRVNDALIAAGGGTPGADLDRLNLAAVVLDGQKIYVPRQGEPLPADSAGAVSGEEGGSAAGGAASRSVGGKTNLNSAGLEELGTLPKVGPVLAQRIMDWRKEHGPFTSVEELDAVDGVGPKMLETLLPLVSVE